jgi:predicted RNase H-related nuclease YkuK (DUF458 family)
MLFKRLNRKEEVDILEYVTDYVIENDNIEILIGCDSQNYNTKTTYAIVVALYNKGKGAHVLYRRWNGNKEYSRSIRLLNEVWFSIEVAELLRNAGHDIKFIDVDLNPDPKFKSNEVFRQAVGLVEGMGYAVRYKTLGPMITYAADNLVKS